MLLTAKSQADIYDLNQTVSGNFFNYNVYSVCTPVFVSGVAKDNMNKTLSEIAFPYANSLPNCLFCYNQTAQRLLWGFIVAEANLEPLVAGPASV